MDPSSFHIAFAGGGTAGHLFPGLAVAKQLAARNDSPRITFAVGGKTLETSLVAKSGFDHVSLPSAPLVGGVRGIVRFVGENFSGYRAARRFVREENIDLVVGLGGYASVPLCRAAIAAGIPLVLLEQNVFPGKANRWLAPRADLICAAFAESREYFQDAVNVRVTGNPIRAGFRPRRHPSQDRPASSAWQRRLMILGGSGGAHSLNEFVPKALYKLQGKLAGWQIVHQTGLREADATTKLYQKLALKATVVPFVQNLPSVLRHADLAISRGRNDAGRIGRYGRAGSSDSVPARRQRSSTAERRGVPGRRSGANRR